MFQTSLLVINVNTSSLIQIDTVIDGFVNNDEKLASSKKKPEYPD